MPRQAVRRSGCAQTGVQRGSGLVELAIMLPLAILLIFGILEFGLLFHDWTVLNNACRELAHKVALGLQASDVPAQMAALCASLRAGTPTVACTYRTYSAAGGWDGWQTLADGMYQNNAPAGAQVRVELTYNHPLVMGQLFGGLATETGGATVRLRVTKLTRRE